VVVTVVMVVDVQLDFGIVVVLVVVLD